MAWLWADEKWVEPMLAVNKLLHTDEIRQSITVGPLFVEFLWRSKRNLWGRFGGGWNWIVGVEIGRTTVICNLLVFSLRFKWKHRATGTVS